MYNPKPFNEGFLEEQDGHSVYFAQYGNSHGEAIISLHGGPGSKSKAKHVRCFDLEKYHVVTFDQRGCGKSIPAGSIKNNTTQMLVEDIERLKNHLGLGKWFVTGGSWGSALALAYAEQYPKSVRGLMLSAIFLADKEAMDWSFSIPEGVAMLFPDVWMKREIDLARFGTDAQNSSRVLLNKLSDAQSDTEIHDIVATVLNWEGNLFTASLDVTYTDIEDVTEEDIASVKIFLHFESNNCFLKENQLLQNISAIKDIPMVIVHGRHDVLCPFKGAHDLHKAHSKSELIALPQSNHKFSADGEVAKKYAFEAFLGKYS
jgi:proline iminopeptidase